MQRLLPPMASSRLAGHNRIAVIRAPKFEPAL